MMKHIQLKWKPYHVLQFKDSKNYAIQQGAGMAVMKTTKTKQQAAVEF